MSNLNDREKAHENKFAHDAQIEFKAMARRNKLVGLWAAEKLGKSGEEAASYAKDVVMSDLEAAGDHDMISKLLADFGKAHLTVPVTEIEAKILELAPVARRQIMDGQ